MAVMTALVRAALVGEAVDLGALGLTDDTTGNGHAGELGRGGEDGVAVNEENWREADFGTLFGSEQLDGNGLAFGNLLLLATRCDHCVHNGSRC